MTRPATYTMNGCLVRVVRVGRAYTASAGALVAHGATEQAALAALAVKMEADT